MKSFKKSLSILLLAAVGGTGYMFGTGIVRDAQFARAEAQVQTSREQLSKAEDLSTVFRNVGKAVEPSVVQIEVHKTIKGVSRSLPVPDDMLRRFFPDRNGDGEPDLPEGFGNGDDQQFEQQGTGSGVIMEVDGSTGYILTNNHVAGGADEMTIALADGRTVKNGKLLGADPKSDLAVIKIDADHLIPAKWGDSGKLQKGDWVMAFGSPFGYIGSMSHGIVSALNRDIGILGGRMGYENFIQVDAPINPGNSGGPLVDVQGNVVGINTAIASRTGWNQGVGFAIPSNQAKFVYDSLKSHGKVTRGWLGVGIANVSARQVLKIAEDMGYDKADGVFVQEVMPDTPASGKLEPGDIVTAVNGDKVKDVHELRNRIASVAPSSEVTLAVFRNKKTIDVKLKVGEQPDDMKLARGNSKDSGETAESTKGTLGMGLADINDDLKSRFGIDASVKGAVVREVDQRGPAAREGIRPGDVITKVGNQSVTNAKEAKDALKNADLSKGVRLYVVGRDASRFVFIQSDK